METERKFLLKRLPENLSGYAKKEIEQGYLCTNPVIRIRKSNDDYYMTYKSRLNREAVSTVTLVCEEVELPLTMGSLLPSEGEGGFTPYNEDPLSDTSIGWINGGAGYIRR